MSHPQKRFMNIAIQEAIKSAKSGQYALGVVVVINDEVISIVHTSLHETNDPSAHAEMNAVRDACKKLDSRYLKGAWLYTTQEPCPMCTSVAVWAKMKGIVFGALEKDALRIFKNKAKSKFTWRQINISAADIIAKGEPRLKLYEGFMRDDCIKLYDLNN